MNACVQPFLGGALISVTLHRDGDSIGFVLIVKDNRHALVFVPICKRLSRFQIQTLLLKTPLCFHAFIWTYEIR